MKNSSGRARIESHGVGARGPSAPQKRGKGKGAARIAAVASAIAWVSVDAGATDYPQVTAANGQSISLIAGDRVNVPGTAGISLVATGTGVITATGTSITTGQGSQGVVAQGGGRVELGGGTVSISTSTSGLWATGIGSFIGATGTGISDPQNAVRSAAFGAAVRDGARMMLSGVTFDVRAVEGAGVSGAGSVLESVDTAMRNTLAAEGVGYKVMNGGHLTLRGGSIESSGHGVALWDGSATADVNDTKITTTGNFSAALNANGDGTALRARKVSITTRGSEAFGVLTRATGASVDLKDAAIETWGDRAHGIAQELGIINAEGGSVLTRGSGSVGVHVNDGGAAVTTVRNMDVSTRGAGSHGVLVAGAGRVVLDNVRITTEAGNAAGVVVVNGGAAIDVRNSRIRTLGDNAAGIQQGNTAKLAVSGTTVATQGSASPAFVSFVQSANHRNTATLTDSTLGTQNSPAMLFLGGHYDVTVKGSEVTGRSAGAHGQLLAVQDLSADFVTKIVTLKADSSSLVGDVLVFSPSADVSVDLANRSTLVGAVRQAASVALDSTSAWRVRGDSTVGTVGNGGNIAFVAPAAGENFKTLVVNNYVGTNGALTFNARLGDSTSPADKLVIDGGTAKGSTRVFVQNAGGLGAQTTGDGIVPVDAVGGGTTEPTAFRKGGRIAAGAYEYALRRGGAANAQAWYLSSTYVPPPPPAPAAAPADAPGEPLPPPSLPPSPSPVARANYRAEVPVYSALPMLARAYGHALVGTLDDRMGGREPARTTASEGPTPRRGWGRLVANGGRRTEGDFWRDGSDYRYDLSAAQVGADLLDTTGADLARDKVGVYGAFGQLSADVRGIDAFRAGGRAGMHAYSLGGYWTHRDARGWYTDSVVQATHYRARAATADQRIAPHALGLVLSGEGGYSFDLAPGLTLTPQAQLIYQHLDLDGANDAYGTVDFGGQGGLLARAGARLSKAWSDQPDALTASLYANVWHAASGRARATFGTLDGGNAVTLAPSLSGTSGEIGVDVSGQITPRISVFVRASYTRGLGQAGQAGWRAHAGATFRW